MKQTFQREDRDQWSLRNQVSIFFIGFEEIAKFKVTDSSVTPSRYEYKNKFSKKRNSRLIFHPQTNSVVDALHSDSILKLPEGALDKLSFQLQLRHDVAMLGDKFLQSEYHLVDRTKFKTYTVKNLGEEIIDTPAGRFNAIKLQQKRVDKDKHTLIWLAKELDYFVLRVERVENGESDFKIELKSLEVDGERRF